MKWLLLLVLVITGCTTPNLGENQLPPVVPLDSDLQAAQDRIQEVLNNPQASVKDLLEALGIAQDLGWELDQDQAKNLGLEGTIQKEIYARIQNLLALELVNPQICKRRALEIKALTQQLGFAELEKLADLKVQMGADLCGELPLGGESTISMTSTSGMDEGPGTLTIFNQKRVIDIRGKLRERTPQGDSRSYYFAEGKMDWSLETWLLDGCALTTITGSGTEELNSPADGYIGFSNDGIYGGRFSKEIIVTVRVTSEEGEIINRAKYYDPLSVDEDHELEQIRDQCQDVKEEEYQEQESIGTTVSGTVSNPNLREATITGAVDQSRRIEEEAETSSVKGSWALRLP